MTMNKPEDGGSESGASPPAPRLGGGAGKRVVVVGAGKGGCSVLACMASRDCDWPRLVCLDTKSESSRDMDRMEHIVIERPAGRTTKASDGSGIGAVKQLCAETDLVIVVAGLGGRFATEAALSVIEAAKARGAFTLCFAILPFEFEGLGTRENARRGLDAVDEKADCVVCLPGQRLFKAVEKQLSVADAFRKVDEMVGLGVYAIWRGLCGGEFGSGIELGFDDLRALISAGSGRCVFACANSEGSSKADDVVNEIAGSPMLKCGKAIENAAAVIVSVVCGSGLSVFDMNRIISGTVPVGSGQALIKTGISCDPARGDRVSVLVLVSERDEKTANAGLSGRNAASATLSVTGGEKAESTGGHGGTQSKPVAQKEKLKQQNLFDSDKVGRFKGMDPTVIGGNNLDIPTFIRRGILVRKQRTNA